MLIETSIKARRDNTVRVVTTGGAAIVFAADETGLLVADVEDQADLAFLLLLGDFFPANEPDYAQAGSILLEETGADDLPDDLPDDSGDEDAAPVELVTPRKPGKPAKARK